MLNWKFLLLGRAVAMILGPSRASPSHPAPTGGSTNAPWPTTLMDEIRGDFERLYDSFFSDSETVGEGTGADKQKFVDDCWRRADEACARWAKLEQRNYFVPNNAYRAMWDEFNRAAALQL